MASEAERQPQKTEGRQPPPEKPALIRVFRALKRYEDGRRRRHKKEADETDLTMARWTRRVGLFNLALVIVSIVTGVIFWRQLNVMQRQLNEMQDDQRPWLGMSFAGYPPSPAQLGFKNGGASPAFNVSIKAFAWQPASASDLPTLPSTRCTVDCTVSGIELLPNVPFQSVLLRPEGDVTVWIIGRADYEDSHGRPHKTGVCLLHVAGSHDLRDCPIPGGNYAD